MLHGTPMLQSSVVLLEEGSSTTPLMLQLLNITSRGESTRDVNEVTPWNTFGVRIELYHSYHTTYAPRGKFYRVTCALTP